MSLEAVQREWINPYKVRVREHPGRIYLLEGDAAEESELRARIAASSQNIIELGSGSGQHLIELGKRHPESACWGFEIRYKRSVRTIEKAKLAGADNVFVLRTLARRMGELFPPRSVVAVYVNFSDPWSRPKQWKNRILGPELLNQANSLLAPGGFISAKTDHADYYDAFLDVLRADARYEILAESRDLAQSDVAPTNIITEFESLFLSQRLPVHYVKAGLVKAG